MAMEAAEVVMEAVEMAMAGAEVMGLIDGRSAYAECDGSGGDGGGGGGQEAESIAGLAKRAASASVRVGAA